MTKKTKMTSLEILACTEQSNVVEGIELSEEQRELSLRYLNGEISGEEALKIVKNKYKEDF